MRRQAGRHLPLVRVDEHARRPVLRRVRHAARDRRRRRRGRRRRARRPGAAVGAGRAAAARSPSAGSSASCSPTSSGSRRSRRVATPRRSASSCPRYFDLAREVIARYGGTVEKFIGDAVMAVWGAPVAHEDDAERAVRAALELVDAVRTLGPEVQARAGVLTGEAAVTLGATDQGMVAGDLVNTASRLQSVAAPGTVLVGEATQRAASQAIAFEPAGEQVLKGKEAPVPAWRALRVVARAVGSRPVGPPRGAVRRSRRGAAPAQGPVPRDVARSAAPASSRSPGRPGSARPASPGSSRSTSTASSSASSGTTAARPAYGEGITFWALGEMVRGRAGLAETDDPETTRAQDRRDAGRPYVPDETERRWIEPALLALLGVADAPAGGRDELFRAWRTFFERIAATGTVALVFEDLHWADPGLLDFIDHLLEWSRGVPILIITLARPGAARPPTRLGRRPAQLPRARPRAARRRGDARAARGPRPGLPPAAARSIIERADGIPLYAVEMIRMLVGDGRLREADGRYEPVGELGELAVPETLQALIAARLDGLDPTDRTLLQDASVLGQSFTLEALTAVNGGDEAAIAARLHDLAGDGAHRPARRPALAGARAVHVRPGAHPRGRVRDARQARPAHATSRRGAVLRIARRGRARRRARGALRRRVRGRPRGPRGRRPRRPGAPGARSAPPIARWRSRHPSRR